MKLLATTFSRGQNWSRKCVFSTTIYVAHCIWLSHFKHKLCWLYLTHVAGKVRSNTQNTKGSFSFFVSEVQSLSLMAHTWKTKYDWCASHQVGYPPSLENYTGPVCVSQPCPWRPCSDVEKKSRIITVKNAKQLPTVCGFSPFKFRVTFQS